ncbi:hypothetical protein CAEBREN_25475 [Caenorhabditis brenneri]|uniref:Uncharacterized protein n=1 Tax=Caenorhabditis brenneri TaxID=135651 RepID=G0P7U2_CAEBE|nr:hypothetical protein CAEBREN_25475 [Caenorhabditis brenneri]
MLRRKNHAPIATRFSQQSSCFANFPGSSRFGYRCMHWPAPDNQIDPVTAVRNAVAEDLRHLTHLHHRQLQIRLGQIGGSRGTSCHPWRSSTVCLEQARKCLWQQTHQRIHKKPLFLLEFVSVKNQMTFEDSFTIGAGCRDLNPRTFSGSWGCWRTRILPKSS